MTTHHVRDAISGLTVWLTGDSIMRNTFFVFSLATHMSEKGARALPKYTTVQYAKIRYQQVDDGGLLYTDELYLNPELGSKRVITLNASEYGLPSTSKLRYFPSPTLMKERVPPFPEFWDLLETQIAFHNVTMLMTDAPDVHSAQNVSTMRSMTAFLMTWGRKIYKKHGCRLVLTGFPIQQQHKKRKYPKQNRDWSISVFDEILKGVSRCSNDDDDDDDCTSAPLMLEMLSIADAPRHGETTIDGTHHLPFASAQHVFAIALGLRSIKASKVKNVSIIA